MIVSNFIFDLDGTLVDSLPGIEASTRRALEIAGIDRPLPPMRELVGPPIATMLARLWPDLCADQLAAVLRAFRQHYDAEGCLASTPYPGVPETLHTLQAHGARLFVLTNKPFQPSRRLLGHHGLETVFTDIVSPDSVTPAFSRKSDGAMLLSSRYGLSRSTTVLMGDGLDDSQAAAEHGFGFITAVYGYGSAARTRPAGALASAESFSDILNLLPATTLSSP